MMSFPRLASALALAALLAACGRPPADAQVTVVTTTEVAGTGVDAMLVRTFFSQKRMPVTLLVTEERLVGDLVRKGVADVVLTKSASLRQTLRRDGQVRLSETFASEHFVLAGPGSDPARARRAPSASEAFRRVARRDRTFCSAADVPDLREREAAIWRDSRATPADDRRYRHCHGDAEAVLRESARRGAYTLTRRSLFDRLGGDLRLEEIESEGTRMRDDYAILLVTDPRRNRNALWFVQWVMSARARALVAQYRFDGGRQFAVRGQQ